MQKVEQRLLLLESGLEPDQEILGVDFFQLQHHHLLTCLEKSTGREFVETEVTTNSNAVRRMTLFQRLERRAVTPSPSTHSKDSNYVLCCSCCRGKKRQKHYQMCSTPEDLENLRLTDPSSAIRHCMTTFSSSSPPCFSRHATAAPASDDDVDASQTNNNALVPCTTDVRIPLYRNLDYRDEESAKTMGNSHQQRIAIRISEL